MERYLKRSGPAGAPRQRADAPPPAAQHVQHGAPDEARLLSLLQQYWGYREFREPQLEIITSALAGKDNLVVMATGGGKSLCYQVPALAMGKVVLVVSPLISLMHDQVDALNARGVPAAFLGSAQTNEEIKRRAWDGEYALVYVTPELVTSSGHALRRLHATKGVAMIAVDEAHCISEYGHDFRPAFRQLSCLRDELPGVPIMALTATATQRVRQDIQAQLRLGAIPAGGATWVTSFERPNLHFSARPKPHGLEAALAPLVQEAQRLRAAGRALPATLVYCPTTAEVDQVAAALEAKGVPAARYHAKLGAAAREAAHAAFLRDDVAVLAATIAYGMGIDKPNVRRLIHWGVPASLEAYFQQAGRAGRDGLPAKCELLWSHGDFAKQDFIRGQDGALRNDATREAHERGLAALQGYCSGGGCRHAALVNYFQPGSLPEDGPCAGGCDCCDAAARAGGAGAGERDLTREATLLLAGLDALKNYGLSRVVQVLRGSKNKDITPWMMQKAAPDGTTLHGAGHGRSEAWWKGLHGLLVGKGLVELKTMQGPRGSYTVSLPARAGSDLLHGRGAWSRRAPGAGAAASQPAAGAGSQGAGGPRLMLRLPSSMDEEDAAAAAAAEAERERARKRAEARAAADGLEAERDDLVEALRAERKRIADGLGQAPDLLVNDATLRQLALALPRTADEMGLVSGMGREARRLYGPRLLAVITEVVARSAFLKNARSEWVGGGSGSGRRRAGGVALPAPAAAGDPDLLARLAEAGIIREPKGAALEAFARWQAGESVDDIASNRPKPIQAATVLSYLAEAVAYNHPDALPRLMADAGLADGGGGAGSGASSGGGGGGGGGDLVWRVRSALFGGAAPGSGPQELVGSVKAAKDRLGEAASYGQIKVVAAALALGVLPDTLAAAATASPALAAARAGSLGAPLGAPAGAGGAPWAAGAEVEESPEDDLDLELSREIYQREKSQSQQQQQPASQQGAPGGQPQGSQPAEPRAPAPRALPPHLARVLQAPGPEALEVHRRWLAGMPLAQAGALGGGINLAPPQVLGHIADVIAAHGPAAGSARQLAADAGVAPAAAARVGAALRARGARGMWAVKQALGSEVGNGTIKVVAAMCAAGEGDCDRDQEEDGGTEEPEEDGAGEGGVAEGASGARGEEGAAAGGGGGGGGSGAAGGALAGPQQHPTGGSQQGSQAGGPHGSQSGSQQQRSFSFPHAPPAGGASLPSGWGPRGGEGGGGSGGSQQCAASAAATHSQGSLQLELSLGSTHGGGGNWAGDQPRQQAGQQEQEQPGQWQRWRPGSAQQQQQQQRDGALSDSSNLRPLSASSSGAGGADGAPQLDRTPSGGKRPGAPAEPAAKRVHHLAGLQAGGASAGGPEISEAAVLRALEGAGGAATAGELISQLGCGGGGFGGGGGGVCERELGAVLSGLIGDAAVYLRGPRASDADALEALRDPQMTFCLL